MSDYIDRQTAKEELNVWAVYLKHPKYLVREVAMSVLDSMPAADVVKVIRCNDCIHAEETENDNWIWCHECRCKKKTFGYCEKGERKETNNGN